VLRFGAQGAMVLCACLLSTNSEFPFVFSGGKFAIARFVQARMHRIAQKVLVFEPNCPARNGQQDKQARRVGFDRLSLSGWRASTGSA
jgi:hypothetical protein